MADLALVLEAEKRGILPADKRPLLEEARKRGLVPAAGPVSEVPDWQFGAGPPKGAQPPAPERGIVDQAIGVGEAALTAASAVGAVPAATGQTLASGVTNALGITEPKGKPGAEQYTDLIRKYTYEPRTEAGKEKVEGLGKALDASKLAGLGPTEAIALGGSAPGAATAARSGAEAVAAAPGKAAARAKGALTPSPEALDLARKASDVYGIPLRPDMLTDNRVLRMVGEALEQVPLSGSQADARKVAFNRAIMKQIGANQNEKRLTPAVFNQAMLDSGEKIGDISAKHPIPLETGLTQKLAAIAESAQKYETADVAKVITNYIGDVGELGTKGNGTIDGVAFRKLRTKIGAQMRRQQGGDLKHALSELDDVMLDAIQGQLTPKELEQFTQARYNYANAKTISSLVGKSETGDISPAGLMGAVTNTGAKKEAMARGRGGELGDLARIGQRFVKEPKSSGTAERGLAYGLAGGAGALEPTAAAGVFGAANLYNRAGAALSRKLIKTKKQFDALPPGEEFVDGRTGKVSVKGGGE